MPDDRPVIDASPVVLGPPTGWLQGRRRRRTGRLAGWAPPAVVFGLFVGAWYLVSEVVLDERRRFLLPPPDDIIAVAFLDPANRAPLLDGLALSAGIAMVGLAIAAVLGLAIGIAMSQARWVERSLYPYAVVLQCIPTLALVPVIGFWFDFGLTSRLIVTVAIAIFPVISSTLFGLQSADRSQHDLLTLHRAGRLTRLVKLQLPNAMPAILTGLQVAATLAVVGAVVGDFFFRQGERRHRRAHRPLPGPPAVRAAVRRGDPGLPAGCRGVQRIRVAEPAGHWRLVRIDGLRRAPALPGCIKWILSDRMQRRAVGPDRAGLGEGT